MSSVHDRKLDDAARWMDGHEHMNRVMARARLVDELVAALKEAESGLEFAGAATVHVGKGRVVPAPTAALRIVRDAIAKAEAK